jgi:RNA polymerase sigma factor (sigma-70 family)
VPFDPWRDDMLAEAFYNLTRIVMREMTEKRKIKDGNITRYISSVIKRRLQHFYSTIPIVRIKSRKKGPDQIELTDHILRFPTQTELSIEFQETLQLAIRTPNERKVITLRAQGYTQKEVAQTLGLSVSRVSQLNCDVETRFDRLNEA